MRIKFLAQGNNYSSCWSSLGFPFYTRPVMKLTSKSLCVVYTNWPLHHQLQASTHSFTVNNCLCKFKIKLINFELPKIDHFLSVKIIYWKIYTLFVVKPLWCTILQWGAAWPSEYSVWLLILSVVSLNSMKGTCCSLKQITLTLVLSTQVGYRNRFQHIKSFLCLSDGHAVVVYAVFP